MLSFALVTARATTRMFSPAGPQQWLCAVCAQWVGVPTVQAFSKGVPVQACQYCVGSCR